MTTDDSQPPSPISHPPEADTPGAIRPVVAPCPHCQEMRDVTTRITGDVSFCPACRGWFRIRFGDGGAELLPCETPATWPKERRNP